MTDVPEGFPKPKQTRPWQCRRQEPTCTRTKRCPSCRGAHNRRSGQRAQRAVRKELEDLFGVQAARFVGMLGNEESWQLPVRVEVKSGDQVDAIYRRFVDAHERLNADYPMVGPLSRFRAYVPATFTRDTLVVCAGDALHQAFHDHAADGYQFEMTAGKPFWTRHLISEEQANRSTAIGDRRPFLAGYSPTGTRINLYSFRLSVRERIVEALSQ